MTRTEILERLAPLAERILQIEAFTVETDMEATPEWTSLKHVQLLGGIERAFAVEIADREAFRLHSGARLLAYLEERLAQPGGAR